MALFESFIRETRVFPKQFLHLYEVIVRYVYILLFPNSSCEISLNILLLNLSHNSGTKLAFLRLIFFTFLLKSCFFKKIIFLNEYLSNFLQQQLYLCILFPQCLVKKGTISKEHNVDKIVMKHGKKAHTSIIQYMKIVYLIDSPFL